MMPGSEQQVARRNPVAIRKTCEAPALLSPQTPYDPSREGSRRKPRGASPQKKEQHCPSSSPKFPPPHRQGGQRQGVASFPPEVREHLHREDPSAKTVGALETVEGN